MQKINSLETKLDLDQKVSKKSWSDEETRRLLMIFKTYGSKWSMIAKMFPGRSENEVKNKFYTTLKRVVTRAHLEDPAKYPTSFGKSKESLIKFVDLAILFERLLSSKRGRKKNLYKRDANENPLIINSILDSQKQEKEIAKPLQDFLCGKNDQNACTGPRSPIATVFEEAFIRKAEKEMNEEENPEIAKKSNFAGASN